MIKLLAPATVAAVGDPDTATVILEMDRDVFRALAVAVEVAYDDETTTPTEYAAAAAELWQLFNAGRSDDAPR